MTSFVYLEKIFQWLTVVYLTIYDIISLHGAPKGSTVNASVLDQVKVVHEH